MAPLDPIAAVTHAAPYGYYQTLAAERPLYRDGALGLWVASSAAAVTAALESVSGRVRPPAEPVPAAIVGSPAGEIFGSLVRMNDGARHAALRPAVMRALAGIDPVATAHAARDWLDETIAERGGKIGRDALDEILFALPLAVMAALLGVPADRRRTVAAAIGDFVRGVAPGGSAGQVAQGKRAAAELLGLFGPLKPRDGLVGRLREEMGEDAVGFAIANAIGFLFQTHDATAGLIGNALVTAAEHPDAYRHAREHAQFAAFVDEVLRFDPPVHNTRRFLAEDAVIAGQAMRAGEAILVVLAAAGRDPLANPHPERFDLDRRDRRIFTFGLGRHACPGQTIAAAIAAAAVERLVPALDGPIDGVAYRPLSNVRIPVFSSPPELAA
jgi:cytochrome P450